MGEIQDSQASRREFRALWLTELISVSGDQLAKVAVAVLVYQRTGSAVLTGAAYALTLLPPLVTGPVLAGLSDRFPRRAVMVGCCLTQAAFVVLMVPPGMPLVVVAIAITLVTAASTPFRGAQAAVVLAMFGPQGNRAARRKLSNVRETGQLLGLAGAAGVVATLGTTASLVADAASFLIGALLLGVGLHPRPAPHRTHSQTLWLAGIAALWSDRAVRTASALVLLVGLTAVPDGVIVPLVHELGAPTWTVGPLLAADCVGIIAGNKWMDTLTLATQQRLLGPLAVLSMAPLAAMAARPPLIVVGVLLALSGVGSAYFPAAASEVTERVADEATGAASGVLSAGLRASQGLAVVAGSGVAQLLHSAAAAITAAGAAGVVLTGSSALRWYRNVAVIREVKAQ